MIIRTPKELKIFIKEDPGIEICSSTPPDKRRFLSPQVLNIPFETLRFGRNFEEEIGNAILSGDHDYVQYLLQTPLEQRRIYFGGLNDIYPSRQSARSKTIRNIPDEVRTVRHFLVKVGRKRNCVLIPSLVRKNLKLQADDPEFFVMGYTDIRNKNEPQGFIFFPCWKDYRGNKLRKIFRKGYDSVSFEDLKDCLEIVPVSNVTPIGLLWKRDGLRFLGQFCAGGKKEHFISVKHFTIWPEKLQLKTYPHEGYEDILYISLPEIFEKLIQDERNLLDIYKYDRVNFLMFHDSLGNFFLLLATPIMKIEAPRIDADLYSQLYRSKGLFIHT